MSPHYYAVPGGTDSWGHVLQTCVGVSVFLQSALPFAYDLEKVIDDWIMMSFLVGNDFLPHLPNMHIRQVKGQMISNI